MPGPLPKRIEERRRRNAVPGETVIVMEGAVEAPDLPAGRINPIARAWYESLPKSGQAQFFEPSDWAVAVVAAKKLSDALRPTATASMLNSVWAIIESLLCTEGERRKARLFVQRVATGEAEEMAAPTAIDGYRARLGG